MTLATISENALLASYQDEPNLSGEDKVKRFNLAAKIQMHEKEDIQLSAEDISLLKKLIAKSYGPLVVGEAWTMLDPVSVGAHPENIKSK